MPLPWPVSLAVGILAGALAAPAAGTDLELDARVVWVSSGPWVFTPDRYRHRAVAWETGGEMHLRVEKIGMSPAGLVSLVGVRVVDLESIDEPIYTIDRPEWSRPDRFALRINGLPYGVIDLDRDVPVTARPR